MQESLLNFITVALLTASPGSLAEEKSIEKNLQQSYQSALKARDLKKKQQVSEAIVKHCLKKSERIATQNNIIRKSPSISRQDIMNRCIGKLKSERRTHSHNPGKKLIG